LEHGVLVGSAVLLPLTEALDDPDTLQDFVAELGWELPASATAIGLDPAHVGAVVTAFEDVVALGDTVPDDATVAARYAVLLGALAVLAQDVYDLRTSIAAHLDAAFLNASQIAQQLPKRLFDYLLMEYVREANEPVYQALVVAGIFETTDVPRGPATFTSEHVQRTVHYDRARTLLTDPKDLFHDVYGWGDAAARLDLLIDRLYELGDSLGVPVALRYPLLEAELALNSPGTVVLDGEATQPELDLPLLATRVGGASAELGLSLFILHPETATGPPGLALGPYAAGELEESIAIDRFARWLLRLAATLDLKFGIAVVARPGQPLRIVVDPAGAASQESGSAVVELRRDSDPDEELPLVSVDGSGVSARGIYARAGVALLAGKPGLMFELGADQGRAGISLSGSDSFVARVLPSDIPDLNFDLGIAWSSLTGFSFKGAAALELAVAARAQLGPITLQTVYLALGLDAEGVGVVVAIAADARLGPVTATVDHVGVRFEARSKGSGGNLGPLDVRAQFEPPKGLGLAVDAVAVKGGGYIFFDNDKKQYAGVLELSLEDTVQLKVIGILDTILPGGQPGFSLLLIITAEFEPIQLGFGFTLNGVGGLAGINRTMLLDVLRAGLRNRTLDSILFPPDPVANAPKIISDLSAVFPPVEGRYAFGPQLKIGWGTPTLISAAVGIFIELPPPIRLAILAQIKAALPEEEAALIEIHMDAIGTYEQEKQAPRRRRAALRLADRRLHADRRHGDAADLGGQAVFRALDGRFQPALLDSERRRVPGAAPTRAEHGLRPCADEPGDVLRGHVEHGAGRRSPRVARGRRRRPPRLAGFRRTLRVQPVLVRRRHLGRRGSRDRRVRRDDDPPQLHPVGPDAVARLREGLDRPLLLQHLRAIRRPLGVGPGRRTPGRRRAHAVDRRARGHAQLDGDCAGGSRACSDASRRDSAEDRHNGQRGDPGAPVLSADRSRATRTAGRADRQVRQCGAGPVGPVPDRLGTVELRDRDAGLRSGLLRARTVHRDVQRREAVAPELRVARRGRRIRVKGRQTRIVVAARGPLRDVHHRRPAAPATPRAALPARRAPAPRPGRYRSCGTFQGLDDWHAEVRRG